MTSEQGACPFCLGLEPEVIIIDGALAVAAISRQPIHRHHVLIFPRRHVEHLADLSIEELGAITNLAQRISPAIATAAHPDAITLISDDDVTGAGYNLVSHWKLHLIPRFQSEAVRIDWAREEDPGLSVRAGYCATIREQLASS